MVGLDAKIGVLIAQDYQGHDKMVQAIQDSRWYDAEVKKFKQSADNSRQSALQYADSLLRQAEAHRRLRTEMEALSNTNGKLNGQIANGAAQVRAIAGTFSALPGPVGGAASSLNAAGAAVEGLAGGAALMAVGVVAGAAAIALIAKEAVNASIAVADHVEHMQVLGLQTGLTVRETEQFDAALKNMGLNIESITPSFRFLSSNIVAAVQTSGKARDAFKAVGVSVQDLKTKTEGQIFKAVIEGLGGIESHAIRSDTAVKLLGRGALQVLPLAGAAFKAAAAQAEQVGLVLSDSEQKIGESIDHSRDQINRAQEGMKLQLGVLASILVDPFLKMQMAATNASATSLNAMTTLAVDGAKVMDHLADHAKKAGESVADALLKKVGLPSASDLGAMFLNEIGLPRVTVKPGPGEPQQGQAIPTDLLSSAQQDAIQAVKDQIAGMERLRAVKHLLVDDEIAALRKMEDEAIKLADQVVAAQELLSIRKQINSLIANAPLSSEDQSLIEWLKSQQLGPNGLTQTPLQRGELLQPNFGTTGTGATSTQDFLQGDAFRKMGEGAESQLKAFDFTKDSSLPELDRLLIETATEVDKLTGGIKGMNQQFHLSAEESERFSKLIQSHQDEINAAYNISEQAGEAAAKKFADQAKAQQRTVDLEREAMQSLRNGITNVIHSAVTDFEHLGAAISSIVEQVIQQILEAALVKSVLGLIPGVGPAVSGAAGFVAQGGTLAMPFVNAQHGLMLSGVRGRDTLPIMAQKGEMFVSTQDTDDFRSFRAEVRRSLARLENAPAADRSGPPGDINVVVNPTTLDRHYVQNELMPMLRSLQSKGDHR